MVDVITKVTSALTSLGASVLIPIFIFIMCMVFGAKFKKSLMAGLTFGAAYIGLNLIIGLLISTVSPMVDIMVENWGIKNDILDVGWAVGSAIAYSTTCGALIILVSLGVNILMLSTRLTKTLNVDIWNFWNHAFTASVVYIISGNLIVGLIAGGIHAAFCLVMADRTAKRVQAFYNVPGVSIPHGWAVTSVPIIAGVNWLLDRIPGVKNINWDEKHIQEKWGIFGSPLVLGTVLGLILGCLAGYWSDIPLLLSSAISIGAVMMIIPKFIALFMESLTVVSDAAKKFMKKHFGDLGVLCRLGFCHPYRAPNYSSGGNYPDSGCSGTGSDPSGQPGASLRRFGIPGLLCSFGSLSQQGKSFPLSDLRDRNHERGNAYLYKLWFLNDHHGSTGGIYHS